MLVSKLDLDQSGLVDPRSMGCKGPEQSAQLPSLSKIKAQSLSDFLGVTQQVSGNRIGTHTRDFCTLVLSFVVFQSPRALLPAGGFSVQPLRPLHLFATPCTEAHQASLSITNSWSLLKLMSIELVMASNKSEVAQLCPTLCDPIGYSLPGSSVHGILQARILEWVAFPFSRGSSQPGD